MSHHLTLKFPGLPGDDGRVEWQPYDIEHVNGRSLAVYLADIGLDLPIIGRVVVDGKAYTAESTVTVPVPCEAVESGEVIDCSVEVSFFDTYIPPAGAEIFVVPNVEGKNAALYAGIIGAIAVGIWTGVPVMGGAFNWGAAASGAMTGLTWGLAAGSLIAALTTPKPRPFKDEDGPSSYVFSGIQNDDRAGVPKPILLGELLVGGKRIGVRRRRVGVVPIRTGPGDHDDGAPDSGSEKLEILILIAAHETEGPVGKTDPLVPANTTTNQADIRIDGQHYSQFTGTRVDWRLGQAGQTPIRGFDVVANTYDLSVDLTENHSSLPSAYIYTTIDEVDAFEVLLALQGLSHTDDTAGLQNNTTRYQLDFRELGTLDWHHADYDPLDGHGATRRLTAATRAGRLETRRIDKLPDGSDLPRARYEIRLYWVSADHTDENRDQWHVLVTGVNEEIQKSLNYEGQTVLGIWGLSAEQTATMPTVTAVWRGMPTQKYIPDVGWQLASWGVTDFAPQGKNNYWLALAVLRNKAIGAGNRITDDEIDLDSVALAAPQADASETVVLTDGSTYQEPRHQFSAYIDQEQEDQDLIQQIIAPARGTLIYSGKKWRFAVNKAGPITQPFGMGSMLTVGEPPNDEPTFRLRYKSERHEVNCLEGSFNDREADWQTDSHPEYIDNRDPEKGGNQILTTGTVITTPDGRTLEIGKPYTNPQTGFTQILDREQALYEIGQSVLRRKQNFWGVDRRTEVARELRLGLRQAYALRMFGSFSTHTNGLLAEVYDIIGISNDTPQFGYSGRVARGSTASFVQLGYEVPIDDGVTYELKIRFREPGPDGKEFIETRPVSDAPDPNLQFFALNVASPFTRIPEENDEWFFGPSGRSVMPVRITEIDRDQDDERAISFVEHNDSIYDVSGPIEIIDYSLLPDLNAPPGPIPELRASSLISVRDDQRRVTDVILECEAPRSERTHGLFAGVDFSYSLDNESWIHLASPRGVTYRWEDAPHGIHLYFRAVPYSTTGRRNFAGAAYDDLIPEGYGEPSPIVTGLAGAVVNGSFVLSWNDLGPEFDYEVRTQNPANWATSTAGLIFGPAKSTRFVHELPAARSVQYYVRARDPFGNYSSAAASTTVTDTAPAAPQITTITRYEDGFKVHVNPPAGVTDIVRIVLHASQVQGFTPSYIAGSSTLVGEPLGPNGGDFFFKTTVPGTWYLKAGCADWLTERIGDYQYTTEEDDNILVIAPVNPNNVAVQFIETGVVDIEPSGDGSGPKQKTRVLAKVTWVHTDSVNPANSLVEWQAVLYDASKGITEPLKPPGVVSDPTIRTFAFPDVGTAATTGTAVAAVKAIYKDGTTSDYVTSLGTTIPQPTNPRIRDADDRLVPGYADSFDGSSLPTGFSIVGANHSLTGGGELVITSTSAVSVLRWNLVDWINAYADSRRSGGVTAEIWLKVPNGMAGSQALNVASTNAASARTDVQGDGKYHRIRIPAGVLPSPLNTYSVQWELTAPIGTVWRVTVVALSFESVDTSLDTYVGRGDLARRQFGKDPNGGLYGIAPVRIGDQQGNYNYFDRNGMFFLRNDAGELVTEAGFKLILDGRFKQYSHAATIALNAEGTSNWGLSKKIPTPTSFNRARLIVQDIGNDFLPSDVPASTRVYRWLEAGNFIAGSTPNFQLFGVFFYGGTLSTYRVTGPWTQSAQAKSSLTLASDSTTTDANDAWYYVEDDGALPAPALFPGPYNWVFRCEVQLLITMPLVKNNQGSYYYVDLDFTLRIGKATLGGSQMNLSTPRLTHGPYRVRLFSDGQATLVRVVMGAPEFGAAADRDRQNVKVDWHGQTWESGGSGSIQCEIDAIEWSYTQGSVDLTSIANAEVGFLWAEQYAGGG